MKSRFDWGESVEVDERAPSEFSPGKIGEVCGIHKVESHSESSAFNQPIGTVVYTIEFSNGNSAEIPQEFLSELKE